MNLSRSQLRAISGYHSVSKYLSQGQARQTVQQINPALTASWNTRDPARGTIQYSTQEGGSGQAKFISSTSAISEGTVIPATINAGKGWADARPSS